MFTKEHGNTALITDFKLLTQEPDKEFCAPEVKEGKAITAASDIYSVGRVMMQLMTQYSEAKITWAERATSLKELLAVLSPEAQQVIMSCMARNPS